MSLRYAAICGACVLMALAGPVLAIPVTFEFSGYVTSIVDNGHVLGTDVVVGDRFDGTYTFESTLADSYPASSIGEYRSETSVMHVTIGAFDLWSGTRNLIRVGDGSVLDTLSLSSSDFDGSGLHVSGMRVSLATNSGTVFSDDSLPLRLPPISALSSASLQVEGYRLRDDFVGFSVNGVVTSVPEPLSMALLVTGALLVSGRRR